MDSLTGADHQRVINLVIGIVAAGIVAFFVVRWVLRLLQTRTFSGWAIGRAILGLVVLSMLATHTILELVQNRVNAKPVAAVNSEPTAEPAPVPTLREAPLPVFNPAAPATWVPASMQGTNGASTSTATYTGPTTVTSGTDTISSTPQMPANTNESVSTKAVPATNAPTVAPAQ